jgi:ABC-type amino acid transport substrate-binding protein
LVLLASGALADSLPDTIRIGGDANYPPLESLQKEGPAGFYTDIEDAMAAASGKEITHRLGVWRDIVAQFDAGKIDVLPMFVSAERRKRYLFSSPLLYINHAIYGRIGSPSVNAVGDLKGQRIAVEKGSLGHEQLL